MHKVFDLLICLLITTTITSCTEKERTELPELNVLELDSFSSGAWWNLPKNEIIDLHVDRKDVIAFGIYTVHNNLLKMTAQLFPLYPKEKKEVSLEIFRSGKWINVQNSSVNELGWIAIFRVENWKYTENIRYRLVHENLATYEGVIRKDPKEKNEIVMAALSCNSNRDGGLRPNYVRNIQYQNPDIVFFAGDQSYDHYQHTATWLRFGMQFRELYRDRPCIVIPDDHDVGQGNLWGEGGKKSLLPGGEDGGYHLSPEYVNLVQRAQTSHLPDPYDDELIGQGISTYYTNLVLGGIDFAIIEDRKFKSGPLGKIPEHTGPRIDHIVDPNFDPATVNLPGLKLLGDKQLRFLNEWSNMPAKIKVVLSQTGFSGSAHLLGGQNRRIFADFDSNGWPQNGRNRALELIKRAKAIHIGGDQHLAVVIKHGIEEFKDGPWSFITPSITNDIFKRWWWPYGSIAGDNRDPNSLLPWTGDYIDGFGNKITMYAYANPDNESQGEGYGIIRFKKNENMVTFECWPRLTDLPNNDEKQFVGWPITVTLD